MRVKVSELSGRQLDEAVALALGWKHHGAIGVFKAEDAIADIPGGQPWCWSEVNDWWEDPERPHQYVCGPCTGFPYDYSTNWECAGPIIDAYAIAVYRNEMRDASGRFNGFCATCTAHCWTEVNSLPEGFRWSTRATSKSAVGETHLLASMRAFVMAKIGEEIET